MRRIKYLILVFLLVGSTLIFAQDQKILIFDPNDVSSSFQSTLSQLTGDSVFVADTLEDAIFNYDGLFLFVNYPYILSEEEGNKLIQYTAEGKPAYIYSNLLFQPPFDSTSLWHHIGIEEIQGLLIAVQVDSVTGIDTTFTNGVFIDTSFISWSVPVAKGNVNPILTAWWSGSHFNTTFISGYDSLLVVLDLYNLIDDYSFLQKVLIHFGLIPPAPITVLSPNGGEHFLMGDPIQITWSSMDIDSVKIELSLFNGFPWYTISESTPSDGSFDWIVQAPFTSWDCKIRISDVTDSTVFDESDDTFVIDIFPSVDDSTSSIVPLDFALHQNYPNPFNPVTSIQFVVGSRQFVTLKVYDVLGNEVATLVNEEKQPGTYEVKFNTSSIKHLTSSGIYFYQLKAGSYVETKKMILIK